MTEPRDHPQQLDAQLEATPKSKRAATASPVIILNSGTITQTKNGLYGTLECRLDIGSKVRGLSDPAGYTSCGRPAAAAPVEVHCRLETECIRAHGERPRLAESCRSAFGRGNAEADLHVGTRLDLLYSSCAVQGISTWWSRRRVLTRTVASLVYMVPSK